MMATCSGYRSACANSLTDSQQMSSSERKRSLPLRWFLRAKPHPFDLPMMTERTDMEQLAVAGLRGEANQPLISRLSISATGQSQQEAA